MAVIAVSTLLTPLRQAARNYPEPLLIEAYVRAAQEFCQRSRWLTANVAAVTVADEPQYSLGSDPYAEVNGIRAIDITGLDAKIGPLTERVSSQWDKNADPGMPELYQYVPEGNFALHPTPDQAYNLTITVTLQPKDGATSIDSTLPINWKRTIEKRAMANVLSIPGMPWTDLRRAEVLEQRFNAECHSAFINALRGYNPSALNTDLGNGPSSGAIRTRMLAI